MLEYVKHEELEEAIKHINDAFSKAGFVDEKGILEFAISLGEGEGGIYNREPFKDNERLIEADAKGRYLMNCGMDDLLKTVFDYKAGVLRVLGVNNE